MLGSWGAMLEWKDLFVNDTLGLRTSILTGEGEVLLQVKLLGEAVYVDLVFDEQLLSLTMLADIFENHCTWL